MLRLTALFTLLALVGCSGGGRPDPPAPPLSVGVLPDQSEQMLRRRYEPLLAYLGAAVGREMQLVIPGDYEELLDDFDARRIELGWFGGLSFIQAERRSRARPLVMRDVDLDFTSVLLLAGSSEWRSIDDLEGHSLSFGPRLSTSGHLMPRYFLHQRGIDPESFFSEVRYSNGHDQTAGWVRDGEVDLGAANAVIIESMLGSDRLAVGDVRVLERSPPYRNYLWAAQPDLDRELRERLVDAFLSLDRTLPEHAAILDALGAGGFLPASRSDYDDLRTAADAFGLGGEITR